MERRKNISTGNSREGKLITVRKMKRGVIRLTAGNKMPKDKLIVISDIAQSLKGKVEQRKNLSQRTHLSQIPERFNTELEKVMNNISNSGQIMRVLDEDDFVVDISPDGSEKVITKLDRRNIDIKLSSHKLQLK
jgi:hypothetical protein